MRLRNLASRESMSSGEDMLSRPVSLGSIGTVTDGRESMAPGGRSPRNVPEAVVGEVHQQPQDPLHRGEKSPPFAVRLLTSEAI
jgi:hypothetical protein